MIKTLLHPRLGVGYLLAWMLLLAGCASTDMAVGSADAPRIVPASQWGGTPADETRARKQVPTHITLHHGGVAFGRDKDPRQYLRNLQSWSRSEKRWIDVPYHYAIDLDGNIYEGRRIDFAGDTNTEYDPAGHVLIEVMGNYEEVEADARQLDAIVELMAMLSAKYRIPVEAIRGHRDWSKQTVCPGKNLYRYLENGYFHEKVLARLRTAATR